MDTCRAGSSQPGTVHNTDARDAAAGIDAALAGEPAAGDEVRLRNAVLQTDRDEWRRRAERLTSEVAALREHLTAVCAEGRLGETALLNAQQARRQPDAQPISDHARSPKLASRRLRWSRASTLTE